MFAHLSSRTVRIFISSTFRDFTQERDLLVRKVFPELRRRCRERQVELIDVDLRWGITEEEAQQGRVLPICLAEIDRARPFFMGLIGERYGWVPAAEQFDRSLLIEQPWLESHRGGKSVTELEILHGVLNNPEMAGRAFFYFRDSVWSQKQDDVYASEGVSEKQKLLILKDRIRSSGFPVVENYPDPEMLAERVREDLWRLIDNEFPAGSEPVPLDREALDHATFAASRCTVFVGRAEHVHLLDADSAHDGLPIVVTGESGSGKSALLANWLRLQRSRATPVWVFEHYVGASAQSTTYADVIRRIIEEISRTFGVQGKVSDKNTELVTQLPVWIEKLSAELKARGMLAILMIDGLDQIQDEDSAADLRWFPQQFPAGIKTVVSTRAGSGFETLKKRGWPIVTLPLLVESDRKALVCDYLARYRKSLTTERLNRLASSPASANPLYLTALVDELRVYASHETLDDHIRSYLETPDAPALFGKVLERMESDHEKDCPGLVRNALQNLWAARDGCSEAELLVLLKRSGEDRLPQAVWSPLYVSIEAFLMSRSGLFTFCHAFFRQAVQDRYLAEGMEVRAAHRRLADFFEHQQPSPRVAREIPWQLYQAAETERLNAYLRNPGIFMPLLKDAGNDLGRFIGVACANEDKTVFVQNVLTDYLTQQPDSWANDIFWVLEPLERLCRRIGVSGSWVGKFINSNRPTALKKKFRVIDARVKLLSTSDAADSSFTSKVDELISDNWLIDSLCLAVQNAESLLYDCYYGDGLPADSPTTLADIHAEMRRLLTAAERGFGKRAELETVYVTAEDEEYDWRRARRKHLLLISELRALMAEKEGDFEDAHSLLDDALVMAEGFWGTSDLELLPILKAVVNTAKTSGDSSSGFAAAHRGLNLRLTDGPIHSDVKWWLFSSCSCLMKLGELSLAENLFSEVLQKQEALVGTDHVEIAHTLATRAKVFYQGNDSAREKQDYQRALAILNAVDESDEALRAFIAKQYASLIAAEHATDHNLAIKLMNEGDGAAAEVLLRRVVEGREQSLGWDHPTTLMSVNNLALLLTQQGDDAAAEPLFRRALEGYETSLGPDHPDTLTSVNNFATMLHDQGDNEAAEPLLRRVLEGREKALGPDHSDTLKSVTNLANLLTKQGDDAAAEPLFRRALEGREKSLGPDHPDTLESVNSLASLLHDQGDYAAAEPLFRRALEYVEKALGPDHPDTLTSVYFLATLLTKQGDDAAAEPLRRRALEGYETSFGPDHPDTLVIVNNLAHLLHDQGDYAAAEPLCRRLLEGREKSLGPNHPDTLESVNNLAILLEKQGDYAAAEPLYRRALEGREKAFGPDHPDTLESVNSLANLLNEAAEDTPPPLPAGRRDNEKQVEVTITRAFELGKTVVTQKQWIEVMGTTPWKAADEDADDDERDEYNDEPPPTPEGDNYPAVSVSWDDATEFCKKLTALEQKSGKLSAKQTYRLPTEAEWEYACRAGTTTAFSCGDAESSLGDYAWHYDNSDSKLHEVATKKPNPWGLFDMHGNVDEWCEDWYEKSLSGGNDPKGPSAGSCRVLRGGNWYYDGPSDCRSAGRSYCHPTIRHGTHGFRIVRVLL